MQSASDVISSLLWFKNGAENEDQDEEPHIIEQYVQTVEDFSSQYGSEISVSYTAFNLRGPPSNFPDYGDYPQAFVMRTYGTWWDEAPSAQEDFMPQNSLIPSQDYIEVSFARAVYPIEISIFETYNPGALVRIWAQGPTSWMLLWEGEPEFIGDTPRIFNPNIRQINSPTRILRLEFNHRLLPYYTELDAVLLRGKEPPNLIHTKNNFSYSSMFFKKREPIVEKGQILEKIMASNLHEVVVPPLYNASLLNELMDTGPPSGDFERLPKKKSSPILCKYCKHLAQKSSGSNGDFVDYYIPKYPKNGPNKQTFLKCEFLFRYGYTVILCALEVGARVNTAEYTLFKYLSLSRTSLIFILEDETIISVFKYLDMRSLCRCAQVNRHFNRLALDAILYRSLDLRPYWHCVKSQVLKTLSMRCKFLQKIDLSWCGSHCMIQSSSVVNFIRDSGAELTHLRMNCCKFVDNSVLKAIVDTCSNLQELCLRSVSGCTDWPYLATLKRLKRLDVYRTEITTAAVIAIIRSNPDLEHINVGSCKMISAMDEVAVELGENCPNLISADFWKSYSLTSLGIIALGNCKKLQELDVGWCLQAGGTSDWLSFLSSGELRKLFIGALRGVSERDLLAFIHRAPKLAQLDLLGIRSVSPDIVDTLLAECRELRLLDVSFCDQVQEPHVQEWRAQYPHVSIKRSYQSPNYTTPSPQFLLPNLQ